MPLLNEDCCTLRAVALPAHTGTLNLMLSEMNVEGIIYAEYDRNRRQKLGYQQGS